MKILVVIGLLVVPHLMIGGFLVWLGSAGIKEIISTAIATRAWRAYGPLGRVAQLSLMVVGLLMASFVATAGLGIMLP